MLRSPFELWKEEETCAEYLARQGVSRRQFLSLCGRVAVVLGCGGLVAGRETKVLAKEVADRLTNARRPVVVWLQLPKCTGCLESALRSGDKTLENLLLAMVWLEYTELIMAASGDQAGAALNKAIEQPHLLVVNGAIRCRTKASTALSAARAGRAAAQGGNEGNGDHRGGGLRSLRQCPGGCPNPTGAVGVADISRTARSSMLPVALPSAR